MTTSGLNDFPNIIGRESYRHTNMTLFPKYFFSLCDCVGENPLWHRLAGKLSSIISISSSGEDVSSLISTAWSATRIGHSLRPLIRTIRKATKFNLHELSADSIAQLVIVISYEEVIGGRSSVVAKLDHEFVDQVALTAWRKCSSVVNLNLQVEAIVAVALLGRLSSLFLSGGSKSSHVAIDIQVLYRIQYT